MSNLDFIYKRHSVRQFTDAEVPLEDIRQIIEAATYAPSGKHLQNWHFVVVTNKEKIEGMAKVVEEKNAKIAALTEDEEKRKMFTKYLKYGTFFRNAPAVVLIYAGPYPATGLDILQDANASEEEIQAVVKPNPGIQNIGAATQTLMLAAAELGYGTCWMTSQNYAANEISAYIGFEKEGYYLAAMTPLGQPAKEPKSPPRKPVDEVLTVIE